jgi:tRNA-Thr(GGU) m(6)t(6)A37 methyltransferase TsaA
MHKFELEPIGYIETPFKERFGTPRQPHLVPASWGVLKLRSELNLSEALEGLEGFSHIWLIFVFHQNTNKGIKAKIHPPRMGGEKTGLFATRTPHRPNPIGLSAVKLERIEGGTLYLSGVDLVDGTPILDIKPYLPSSDCLPEAHAGWTATRPERTLKVVFTERSEADIRRLVEKQNKDRSLATSSQAANGPDGSGGSNDSHGSHVTFEKFKLAITQILELDPRPNFYKGTVDNPNPYTDVYGFRLDDFNVVYKMTADLATVLELEPWDEYLKRTKARE